MRLPAAIVSWVVAAAIAAGAAAPVRDQPRTRLVGGITTHVAQPGDTLSLVGARAGVEPGVLAAANGLAADARLTPGQSLRIDNRHLVPSGLEPGLLLINIPQRMLFFEDSDGVEGYPIAVGRATWRTPMGEFVVRTKETNPTWDVPPSILEESRRAGRVQAPHVPPGPDNPLGAFWLGLTLPGVGIHGTNVPSSIFRVTTHGCIRMHPDAIARLFGRVQIGTRGRIIYEPLLLTEQDGVVYLEAHRDVYRRATVGAAAAVRFLADAAGLSERIDWSLAEAVLAARHGVARDITRYDDE